VPEEVSVLAAAGRPRTRREERVRTSGWLLVLESGRDVGAVRAALANQGGVECRMDGRGTLVVVTETDSESDLDGMRSMLSAVPGVRSADLVASFEVEPPAPRSTPTFLMSTVAAAR
jgi:nitrate reductase NapAB chaperone NapD